MSVYPGRALVKLLDDWCINPPGVTIVILQCNNTKMVALFMTSILLGSFASAAEQAKPKGKRTPKPNPVMQPIEDDPSLPRVLLLGDSISVGYTLAVRDLLAGKANVHRAPANCGPTTRGIESIDAWLGEKPWDVIHFNWGLHDLKYMGPTGQNLADPAASDSRQQVPPGDYEANLRKLVQRMAQTKATLIWCSTTPVPEGAQGRVVGDAVKYNEIAAKVMKDNNIAIDDLYAVAKPRLSTIQLPANVHFTPEGSKELAEAVAQSIRQALQQRK
jgi:acyl-CoA thioesterase-1